MSVDIKDFRRHVEGATKREEQKPVEQLLPQAPADVEVADDRLNKLIRVIQYNMEKGEEVLVGLAHNVVLCPDPIQRAQLTNQYAFTKGMVETYRALKLVPGRIIAEEAPSSLIVH